MSLKNKAFARGMQRLSSFHANNNLNRGLLGMYRGRGVKEAIIYWYTVE